MKVMFRSAVIDRLSIDGERYPTNVEIETNKEVVAIVEDQFPHIEVIKDPKETDEPKPLTGSVGATTQVAAAPTDGNEG